MNTARRVSVLSLLLLALPCLAVAEPAAKPSSRVIVDGQTVTLCSPTFEFVLSTAGELRAVSWKNRLTGRTLSLGGGPEVEFDIGLPGQGARHAETHGEKGTDSNRRGLPRGGVRSGRDRSGRHGESHLSLERPRAGAAQMGFHQQRRQVRLESLAERSAGRLSHRCDARRSRPRLSALSHARALGRAGRRLRGSDRTETRFSFVCGETVLPEPRASGGLRTPQGEHGRSSAVARRPACTGGEFRLHGSGLWRCGGGAGAAGVRQATSRPNAAGAARTRQAAGDLRAVRLEAEFRLQHRRRLSIEQPGRIPLEQPRQSRRGAARKRLEVGLLRDRVLARSGRPTFRRRTSATFRTGSPRFCGKSPGRA